MSRDYRLVAGLVLVLASIPLPIVQAQPVPRAVHVDTSDLAMVVSESELASRIGRDVLIEGGTAVDAAIATAFAMAVTWPEAGNIGGGGFMIVRPSDPQAPVVCIDYREIAPASMHPHSFRRDDSTYSHKAVGVPGTVRGLALAHQRFGRLPWKRLLTPAIALARDGFSVNASLAGSLNSILAKVGNPAGGPYAELRRVYGPPDQNPQWTSGDRMVLPDLAESLNLLATEGPDAFYEGPIARKIVDEMQTGNGEISLSDLANYRARLRPALTGSFRGYAVHGAPPPSSGGTCIIEALNILENFSMRKGGRFDPLNVHLIAEASRRAFADRAMHLGDPDFTSIPERLLSKAYAKQLAETIDASKATPSESLAPELKLAPESNSTTHFSVVDGEGMAVSNTYTLEASWGSRIVVGGAGFLLNNEMGDFNWFPGETNRLGRIGTEANLVQPRKRMLSSQSPSILQRDGKLALVTGSPGGRTIINTTLGVILNVAEFGMDTPEAVSASRMHHQWFPDRLSLERSTQMPHAAIVQSLRQRGHQIINRTGQGSAHTIGVDLQSGQLIGVADYRRGGRPAGWSTADIATWDFADLAGTEVGMAHLTSTHKELRWQCQSGTAQSDGKDHLLLMSQDSPALMSLDLTPVLKAAAESVTPSIEIKFPPLPKSGVSTGRLEIGLAADPQLQQIALCCTFNISQGDFADKASRIEVAAIESTRSTLSNEPASLSTRQPFLLRVSVNPGSNAFRIDARKASTRTWKTLAKGEAASAEAYQLFVRYQSGDDRSEQSLRIDRIELLNSFKKL